MELFFVLIFFLLRTFILVVECGRVWLRLSMCFSVGHDLGPDMMILTQGVIFGQIIFGELDAVGETALFCLENLSLNVLSRWVERVLRP